MNVNVSGMTNYSTDPATYLQRLTNGSSSNSPQEVLKEVLGLIGELLKQMQEGGGQGAGAGGGMPGGAGGAPGCAGGMPGGAAGMGGGGGMGGASAAGGAGGAGSAGGAGGAGGAAPMTVQNAAGVLASYMGQNGIDAEDPNAMYQLATNANGSTPPTVQQAAQTMLANPSAYQQIETHDVAGTDGKSGVGNFQWAAQGGLGTAGNTAGGAAGAGGAGGMSAAGGAGGMGGAGGAGGAGAAGGVSGFGARPGATGGLPNAGTLPAMGTTTPAKPGTGDLVKDGKSMQMADEGKAMADFNARDGADFQAMESQLSHGDGNAATKTLAKAVQSGKLSQSDAAAIGAQLQQTANAHGGGKIDDESRKALSDALGGADVLTPGKTRLEVAFTNVTGIKTDSILGVSTK
jgi:hypothetical protein